MFHDEQRSICGDLSGRRDLNPRPTAWEADALPMSYTRVDVILARWRGRGPIVYLRPMLDEILTPEERAMVVRARAFAEEHVAPNAARWEWERHYPLETIKLACAAGLNTIELAKKHGGQGLSFSCKLRAFEEIAKADFAFAFALINHHNACARFARDGQPGHVARLLPRMLTGEVIGCAGLSEPNVGSDFGGLEMTAVKAEGGWKLNGAKAWITNAAVAGLSIAYAQARSEERRVGKECRSRWSPYH